VLQAGVIQGPDADGIYSVQSYGCVQWDQEITVEPKLNEPVLIQYTFERDSRKPGYTEFKLIDSGNPYIYWTRPSLPCLQVWFDNADENWFPEVPLYFFEDTIRIMGVLDHDSS
jgi:hypothetical protein